MKSSRLLSIKQALAAIKGGEMSVEEICERCMKRIKRFKQLNALITDTSDNAMEHARLLTSGYTPGTNGTGQLNGIPVVFKDNFCVKNIKTSCASKMLENYKPPYTATVAQKLFDQGALMVGKANLDEFAMGCGSVDSIYGPVRNPWKYDFENSSPEYEDWYIAGGSSGGSAVAVATGMAYGALGSDTGGSTRNPASFTGIVGLKPTYSRLSRHGLIPLVNSLDVPGIFTRTVDDAVIILNQLAGHDPMDSTTVTDSYEPFALPDDVSVKGLTVGIPKEYHTPGMQTDVVAAWDRVADQFEGAGARVIPVSMPHTQYSIVCYTMLCACEVASNMARYDGVEFGHRAGEESSTEAMYALSRHEGFNDVVRSRILTGNFLLLKKNYDKHFMQAQRVRRLIARDFEQVFQDGVDLLLTPTLIGESIKYSEFRLYDNRARTQEQDVCTQPVNLAGVPAVTVPTCLSSNGLPIGLQLIAKPFHEQQMLSAAKWMEQQVNFPQGNWDQYVFADDS